MTYNFRVPIVSPTAGLLSDGALRGSPTGNAELYGLTSGQIFGAHSQTIGGSGTVFTITVTNGATQSAQLT